MIFNDFVRNINDQYEALNRLEEITSELNKILDLENNWKHAAFNYGYMGLIHNSKSSSSLSNSNKLSNETVQYFNNVRERIIGIDFLEFGEVLNIIKNLGHDLLDIETDKLVRNLKSSYKIIHEYKKSTNEQDRVGKYNEFIHAVRNFTEIFNQFKFMSNYINSINVNLCRGIMEDGLEIQLLDHKITKDTYSNVIDPVYVIYDKLCEISNIKEELVIARVETGSLFAKFSGNVAILKLVAKILGTVHDIGVRNLTREGQKKNLAESTELFSKQFNILKEMQELGLDVDEHNEIARETLGLLMKQSNILLSSSPDVRVNERTLSKSDAVKKLLEKNEYKLLALSDAE